MEDIIKIVKSLKYSGLWIEGVTQTIEKKNKQKNKGVGLLICS